MKWRIYVAYNDAELRFPIVSITVSMNTLKNIYFPVVIKKCKWCCVYELYVKNSNNILKKLLYLYIYKIKKILLKS